MACNCGSSDAADGFIIQGTTLGNLPLVDEVVPLLPARTRAVAHYPAPCGSLGLALNQFQK